MTVHRGLPQETGAGSGGPRPGKGAKDSAGSNSGAQQLSFEPFGGEVRYGHRTPTQQAIGVLLSQTPKGQAQLTEIPHLAHRRFINSWRRHYQQRRQHPAYARETRFEFGIAARVRFREGRDLGDSAGSLLVDAE